MNTKKPTGTTCPTLAHAPDDTGKIRTVVFLRDRDYEGVDLAVRNQQWYVDGATGNVLVHPVGKRSGGRVPLPGWLVEDRMSG